MASFHLQHLLHGADYNPDQWLNYPEILKQDIELMKKAHVNCVSLGIFAWAHLEPAEGQYEFGWMREIIDNLYQNGIYTILATPSGAKPNWMSQKYEEIRRVNRNGQRELQSHRHNHCYTSPVYREKITQMNRRLVQEFNGHPGIILWHLSNEYNGQCFCPLCAEAFRTWLREKYGTLEKLNHEWWAHFWSHTYTSWEQIQPPVAHGETMVHGLNLDWKRFVTDQTVDFMQTEIAALRQAGSELPVTTNLMGFYEGLNYFKFAGHLDIVSWDSYPSWHDENKDELSVPISAALAHDLMRSIKRKPFLLMESTPSQTNWQPASRFKRPGMHMLSSVQAVAHGSDSVQYFQWRKSRGSSEKFHGAVVDHNCRDDNRVFLDVSELGKRLENLSELANTFVKSDVAILYDWENRWAMENSKGPRNIGMHYVETICEHYRPFREMGINADVIDMEFDLSGYKLVIAPMLYMYRAGIAGKLREFVAQGGTLVGTYWSGVVNENDLCFLNDRPGNEMTQVFGLRVEEIDSLYDSQFNSMVFQNQTYKLTELCEIIHIENAEVLAVYKDDFYAEKPVVTCNRLEQGIAYYLAAKAEPAFLRHLYTDISKELSLTPSVIKALPAGVALNRRNNNRGDDFWFVQNYTQSDVVLELDEPILNYETKEMVKSFHLPAYGTTILHKEASKA